MQAHVIEHAGLKLGALSAGDPAKPALVLVHGWPHSKEVYELVLDELSAEHFVLALDLPEIGASRGRPRSADKKELAAIVLGAAEQLGAKSTVIAGFDIGGMIAYAAARDHGRRIVGAVVVNTALPGLDPWSKLLSDPRIWHFAFHALPELPELLVAGRQRAYFDFFSNLLVGRKEALTERYRALFAEAYERPEALSAGFDWYRALEADAERNRMPQPIRTPILYARGDGDGGSPDEYVRGLRRAGAERVTSQVLHGSGEVAPLEVPRAFVQTLVEFAHECHGR